MSVLMMTCELSHMFVHPQVPELDHVISTTCKERIVSFRISESSLEKFDCVSMFLMAIIEDLDRLVRVGVVNNQFFV